MTKPSRFPESNKSIVPLNNEISLTWINKGAIGSTTLHGLRADGGTLQRTATIAVNWRQTEKYRSLGPFRKWLNVRPESQCAKSELCSAARTSSYSSFWAMTSANDITV
jgi:hypothetical protein